MEKDRCIRSSIGERNFNRIAFVYLSKIHQILNLILCMAGNLRQCLKPIKALLLDITGVLYESGSTHAIDGSVAAINSLRQLGIPFRFVTNETQRTRSSLVQKLSSFGFSLKDEEVFAPGPVAAKFLRERNLRPHFLIHPALMSEFEGLDQSSPNCVVLGDAAEHFTYHNLNKCFRVLLDQEEPMLISLGKGKYYKEGDELVLDVGSYAVVLEHALNITATVIGKPAAEFFQSALSDLGVAAEEAAMIGDDLNSDVGAAQNCGMQGILVRTGKYRSSDEESEIVKPNAIFNNLSEFVDYLSKS